MQSIELEVAGKKFVIETGEFARQSDGSVLIKCGETVVLATAVSETKVKEGLNFFPLTIDYQEKTYAAGKIPGGFFKREGRPSEKEVLTSRLIDRTVRPLFPDGFKSETQGIVSVLSFGNENISDIMGIIAQSAALTISNIPFNGPVAAVRVGLLNDELVINPSLEVVDELKLNLVVAGSEEFIIMVEGGGQEVSEARLLEAIDLAHSEIKKIAAIQNEFRDKVGIKKRTFDVPEVNEELQQKVKSLVLEKVREAIKIPGKERRQETLNEVRDEAVDELNKEDDDISREISGIFFDIEKALVRNMILDEGIRTDGRSLDEVRPISAKVGFLPRAHGSALFVRGETQALAVTTLGTSDDEQKIDALEGERYKKFMLHYNFPPFSVGEVRFLRSPGRREIGHGVLAERSIKDILPTKEEFPYTIRIVSDILESNGSSSMATVCGSILSLMDAGVPIKDMVAGIAMGLIKEGDRSVVLTDILGLEDHLGDMDFKVAGTENGISAFQMDVKISGVSREIMKNALEQARVGRLHILGKMKEVLDAPRDDIAPYAPRIYTIKIKVDKIRDVIGTGGKVIRSIIEESGAKINVEDDGLIQVASPDEASARKAIEIIEQIVEDPVVGKIYKGKVKRIMDFGAFVEIMPGTEGLLHISQIDFKRIEKVTDVLKEGDEVPVKVIEMDRMGKIRLSRKEAIKDEQAKQDKKE